MATHPSIPRLRISLNVFLQALLCVLLFGIANYLSFSHYQRWDFSRNQKYTLSPQTRSVIRSLKKPVSFIAYLSNASPVAADTANLLNEYAHASTKMVSVEFVNPYLSSTRAREIATRYKLRENENLVIIDTDGRSKIVGAETMAEFEPARNLVDKPRLRAFTGEAALTSALMELTEPGINRIYYLAGHGEVALGTADSFDRLKSYIERQNIQLTALNLAETSGVPSDAKALLIIAPRYDLSDSDLQALRAYWAEKHGRFFVALEPAAMAATPRFALFLAELGIRVQDDQVLRTVPISLSSGLTMGVLREVTGDFLPGSPITRRLDNVLAQFKGGLSQSLEPNTAQAKEVGIQLQPLIRASNGFWGETRYTVTQGIAFNPEEDHAHPLLAMSAEKGAPSDDRLKLANTSRLVAVGSSGFLSNNDLSESGDLDFVLNSLNWLLDREGLIGVAPRFTKNRTLSLTQSQLSHINGLVMGALPGVVALVGVLVWLKRRR